jgi:hypothetical protein
MTIKAYAYAVIVALVASAWLGSIVWAYRHGIETQK